MSTELSPAERARYEALAAVRLAARPAALTPLRGDPAEEGIRRWTIEWEDGSKTTVEEVVDVSKYAMEALKQEADRGKLLQACALLGQARTLVAAVAVSQHATWSSYRGTFAQDIAEELDEQFKELTNLYVLCVPMTDDAGEYVDQERYDREDEEWNTAVASSLKKELDPEAAAEAEAAAESGRPDESVQFSDIAAPGPDGDWT